MRRQGGHAKEDRPYKVLESIDLGSRGEVFRKILQELSERGKFTAEVTGSFSYSC